MARTTSGSSGDTVEVGGHQLKVSNRDKVLYPDTGFTKGEVIDYYVRISPVLLPHIHGRPVTMRRYPDGVDGFSFFEKHLPKGTPEWVGSVHVPRSPRSKDPGDIEFPLVNELAALVWVANLASLEIHVPQWRVGPSGALEPPDLLVFDLDTGEGTDIVHCAEVALLVREELAQRHGWPAYPKSSGSKGLQVYIPVPPADRQPTWEDLGARDEALDIAETLASRRPDLIVTNMRKSLRDGKILIDWSQNLVAKTTVAPYSLRARSEPTVSTPLQWEEVERCSDQGRGELLRFRAGEVLDRVAELGDLFAPLLGSADADGNGADPGPG